MRQIERYVFQGHPRSGSRARSLQISKMAIFKLHLLHHLKSWVKFDNCIWNYETISEFDRGRFLKFRFVRVPHAFKVGNFASFPMFERSYLTLYLCYIMYNGLMESQDHFLSDSCEKLVTTFGFNIPSHNHTLYWRYRPSHARHFTRNLLGPKMISF